jgi:hypothetical protein
MVNAIRRTGTSGPPVGTPAAVVHVLQAGESFEELAERFGITDPILLTEFRRLNPALAAGAGAPGQQVLVPPGTAVHAAPARDSGDPVATSWVNGFGRNVSRQNRYNAELESARREWPRLDPLVLKSILAQETGFVASAANTYGYAGIAQLGVREARQVGLGTGSSRMRNSRTGVAARVDRARDERLVPRLAIPAAARLLRAKATALERGFGHYGAPNGDDYWRFVAAAYNGGEGTVLRALRIAYGDSTPDTVRWDDLVRAPDGDVRRSPLYRAVVEVGMNPRVKYREISEYARDVVSRARSRLGGWPSSPPPGPHGPTSHG